MRLHDIGKVLCNVIRHHHERLDGDWVAELEQVQ